MLEDRMAAGVVDEAGRDGGAGADRESGDLVLAGGNGEVVAADDSLEGLSVAEVVRRVSDGRVKPVALPTKLRQECVGYLTGEGLNSEEIAEVMKMGQRTVHRDRAAVRKLGAVGPGLALGDELFGEFERAALASVGRLVKMGKDAAAPAYARVWAEQAIVKNLQRLLETASRMKYVESGARRLREQREHPADRVLRELEEKQEREAWEWRLRPEAMRERRDEERREARAARKEEIALEKRFKAAKAKLKALGLEPKELGFVNG